MPLYMGPPGGVVSVAWFDRGSLKVTPVVVGGATSTLVGDTIQSRTGVKHSVDMQWTGITWAEYNALSALILGALGVGPLYLQVPDRVNLLSLNQAAGGDVDLNVRGFAAATNEVGGVFGAYGTLQTTREVTPQYGQTCVKWTPTASTVANGTPILRLQRGTAFKPKYGVCIVPGMKYSAGIHVRSAGAWTGKTIAVGIAWMDAAGAQISVTTGTAAAPTTAWANFTMINATPPGNAVYARVTVVYVSGGTAVLPNALYYDKAILAQGTVLPAWEPGGGALRVWGGGLNYTAPNPRQLIATASFQEA